jgi:hypothetical protein
MAWIFVSAFFPVKATGNDHVTMIRCGSMDVPTGELVVEIHQ